jgi:hypothetical protein
MSGISRGYLFARVSWCSPLSYLRNIIAHMWLMTEQ